MSELAELLLNTEELKNVRHRIKRRLFPLYVVGGILGSSGAILLGGSTVVALDEALQSTARMEYDYTSHNEGSPATASGNTAIIGGSALLAAGLVFAGAERWCRKQEDVVACQMLESVNPVDIPKPRT